MKRLCITATSTSYLKTHRTPTDKPTKSCTAHKQRTSNKDSSSTSTKDLIQFTTNQNLCQCWTWWSSNTSKYSIDVRNDAIRFQTLFPYHSHLLPIFNSFSLFFCPFCNFNFIAYLFFIPCCVFLLCCLDFYHLYFT